MLGTEFGDPTQPSDDCDEATAILSHRQVNGQKKSKANDGAYKLARSLLAYELNQDAGAYQCQAAADAATAGHALLDALNFNGTGSFLRPKHASYQDALNLHGILDAYNNNILIC